ncbi:MAG: hypothetical protein HN936_02780, partial [Bacteroidetes bacterium]|nr:hypothetical protein [Bacteroidota bacterium]
DNDGRTYEVVKIDEQIWMAENLAYLPTIDSANRGAYFVYGYNGAIIEEAKATDNYKTYGVLYKGRSSTISCPNDWHLPSDEDWIQLESSLGMNESDHNSEGWRISGNVGRKLKSRDGWKNGGNGSNSSGFNALPGGYHFLYGGDFDVGAVTYYWTSTPKGSSYSWKRLLYYSNPGIDRSDADNYLGFSVRCIKDE